MKKITLVIFIQILLMSSCQQKAIESTNEINYETLTAFNNNQSLNAVIEIPAGTNLKIEYDSKKGKFYPDQKEGKDRIVEYLGYPGNYGFIPGTLMDKEKGGDGDALDILVLSPSQPTGTVMKVKPIALFEMVDGGEKDHKVIAIPADEKDQTLKIEDYQDFNFNHTKAKLIIQYWFTSYKQDTTITSIRWMDNFAARTEVKRWIK